MQRIQRLRGIGALFWADLGQHTAAFAALAVDGALVGVSVRVHVAGRGRRHHHVVAAAEQARALLARAAQAIADSGIYGPLLKRIFADGVVEVLLSWLEAEWAALPPCAPVRCCRVGR